MGAMQSTSASSTKHVFASDTPVQFSQELIDSLQASSETNSTRAKTLDLHIQQRVAAELSKLQSVESEKLSALKSEILSPQSTSSSPSSPSSTNKSTTTTTTTSSLKAALPSLPGSAPRSEKSSQSVQSSISELQQKLDSRRKMKALPKELERARESVVGCLRLNDRRPLDCWREVEGFKREVRRLEEEYVRGVMEG